MEKGARTSSWPTANVTCEWYLLAEKDLISLGHLVSLSWLYYLKDIFIFKSMLTKGGWVGWWKCQKDVSVVSECAKIHLVLGFSL